MHWEADTIAYPSYEVRYKMNPRFERKIYLLINPNLSLRQIIKVVVNKQTLLDWACNDAYKKFAFP